MVFQVLHQYYQERDYSIVGAGGKLPVNIFGGNYCNGGDPDNDGKPGHFAYHGMQQIMH